MNPLPTALPLLPDAWTNHRRSRLIMEISPEAIEVMVRCVMDEHPLHAVIPLSAAAPLSVGPVEEAIYANPLLLCDFESVTILLRTPAEVVPHDFGPTRQSPDCTPLTTATELPELDAVNYVDTDTLKFLQRTFCGAKIQGHLGRVIDSLMRDRRRSNRDIAYVQLLPHATDVLVLTRLGLRHVASYPVTAPQDSIYYTLAAVETSGFDRIEGEMMLCGTPMLREQVIHTLRTYVNSVMPMIHPANYIREASLELNHE